MMYSAVYKAWLGGERRVVVTAGSGSDSRSFAAHRHLLAAHSGYIKSLLDASPTGEAISVPNVSPEAFAPLLASIYTGYLDLNRENIYAVLLAAHLLHMPRAVDLCRAFLLREQECFPRPPLPPPHTTDLVKPVPRSIVPPAPGLYWPPPSTTGYPPPTSLSSLSAPPNPHHLLLSQPPQPSTPSLLHPPSSPSTTFNFLKSDCQKKCGGGIESNSPPSTSPSRPDPPNPPLSSSSLSSSESPSSTHGREGKVSQGEESSSFPPPRSQILNPSSPPTYSSDSSGGDLTVVTTTLRDLPVSRVSGSGRQALITDVACCDGPVRFRRVLNSNYLASDDSQGGNRSHNDSDNNKALYICHYCKHTFKSHYCYRKHARRHINPIGAQDTALNVQYYPCKTCGSKFPSYYFVHKHRKLCHPDEAGTSTPFETTYSA